MCTYVSGRLALERSLCRRHDAAAGALVDRSGHSTVSGASFTGVRASTSPRAPMHLVDLPGPATGTIAPG